MIGWLKERREIRRAIDRTAIAMLRDASDGHDPYRQARALSHAAQDQGRFDDALIYGRAAAKISKIIGHNFGPKAYGESRDVKPTMTIKGNRIVKTTPWWNCWN